MSKNSPKPMGGYNLDAGMKIIRSRRKTIALIIDPSGDLIVRAPIGVSQSLIDGFIQDKSSWIEKNQKIARSRNFVDHKYLAGERFYFLGKTYPLIYRANLGRPLEFQKAFILREGTHKQAAEIFMQWYKTQAKRIIPDRADDLAHKFGFVYSKIRITSAHTRWGSCSSKKNLSFTWRLVMTPLESIDYVIIHELVHLEHPNHSKLYWERVRSLMPDYKSHRAWLKQYAGHLML